MEVGQLSGEEGHIRGAASMRAVRRDAVASLLHIAFGSLEKLSPPFLIGLVTVLYVDCLSVALWVSLSVSARCPVNHVVSSV